jgi:hypothetical protein
MDIVKELKDLRAKFDNQPGQKLVPEFIKTSFIKLGFQTSDIQSVQPFKNLNINGNDFAVFDSVDNTNTLYKAIQNISDAIGPNSYLTKQAVRSLGNLQHTDNIEGITANYFNQSGITHTGFWDLQRKYDQKGDDYKAIIKADKGRPRKLSATPDLSGTVLPLCPIPNSASKSAPSFNSVKLKASACAALLA